MAVSVAELIELRDRLIRSRASGTRQVDYDGKRITYATDSEMATALADLERRIARAQRRPARTLRIHTSKGL